MTLLSSLPLWAVFVVTTALFLAGYEAGHTLGRRRRARGIEEREELGSLVGAMLGMLGFIIAISFGAQLSRFDSAKSFLLDESTAIFTTFLQTDMLPAGPGSESRELLHRYAVVRSDSGRDVYERIEESKRLQQSLWDIAIAAAKDISDAFPRELYFESLATMIELHQKRVTLGLSQSMPAIFWGVLYLLAILSFAVTGYHGGVTSGRRVPVRPIAVVGFALLVLLIADLDRHGEGSLRLDPSALRDIEARMAESLAARP
jgi:hypothetical protein